VEFLTLEQQPRAVTTARHWVVDVCGRRGLDTSTQDAVELVTAEMVGNAVRHGRGGIVLTVDASTPFLSLLTGDTRPAAAPVLAVSVTDAGSSRPHPRDAADDATSGRGLALVDALSLRWGVTAVTSRGATGADGSGKTTWAVLATTASGAEPREDAVLADGQVP
jgi:serine/threonine-protein kinase RsbW